MILMVGLYVEFVPTVKIHLILIPDRAVKLLSKILQPTSLPVIRLVPKSFLKALDVIAALKFSKMNWSYEVWVVAVVLAPGGICKVPVVKVI